MDVDHPIRFRTNPGAPAEFRSLSQASPAEPIHQEVGNKNGALPRAIAEEGAVSVRRENYAAASSSLSASVG